MASVINRPNGHRWVQIHLGDKRPVIRLGKVSRQHAEHFKTSVERLVSEIDCGPLSPQSKAWLKSISPVHHERLCTIGLINQPMGRNLSDFLDVVFARLDVKKSTLASYSQTRTSLLDFFGKDKAIEEITLADAEEFRTWLKTQNKRAPDGVMAPATVSRRILRASEFFNVGIKKRWLRDNPFAGMRGLVYCNDDRMRFIDRETISEIMEHCSQDWRVILSLCRFGGLRCPSEVMRMRWSDVNWADQTMTVHSPKTERYVGKGYRAVPLFPEVRVHLDDAFSAAPDNSEFIVQRRSSGSGLSNQFERILKRAGVQKWPRLFQNLRSTRETELMEEFPMHVVCAWIGNSPRIASRHYLQITKDHIRRAAGGSAESAAPQFNNGKNADEWSAKSSADKNP